MIERKWTWAAASKCGVSHHRAEVRLQDAYKCGVSPTPSEPLTILVSDGAGSAPFGGEGASLTCRTMAVNARQHFLASDQLPDDATLESWVDCTRDRIGVVASRRGLPLRDFAATLILVLSNAEETVTLHIGDGCAVVRDVESKSWIATTWPDHGEYASMTSFITDEPSARVRIGRHVGKVSAVSAFSDGLERLVLDLQARTPYEPFFDRMIGPVESSAFRGKDRDLSHALATYLNSESVNQRTDDDKTLILAVRR